MGFMQKAVSALVTKYGKVEEGRYEGHILCLGHDPKKDNKPKMVDTRAPKLFDQLIFMFDDEGKARHSIYEDIIVASLVEGTESEDALVLRIVWETGEESLVRVFKTQSANKEESGLAKGLGFLKTMGSSGSKNQPDPILEKYRDFNDFMFSMVPILAYETQLWYRDFASGNNLLPERFMAIVDNAVAKKEAALQLLNNEED